MQGQPWPSRVESAARVPAQTGNLGGQGIKGAKPAELPSSSPRSSN